MLALLRKIWKWIFPPKRLCSFWGTMFLDSSSNPVAFPNGQLVLVGTQEKFKWLKFRCPCGCGDVQALNLMKSHQPVWSLELHEDLTVSLFPSVHAQKCGAHFWVRRSAIHWC